jgi:hypothetical protein
MATITNKLGLPEVLVRALQRDPYSRGKSRYSVTQLIDSPQVRALSERYHEEISRDISDSVWLLLGKGVHHILEVGAADEGSPERTIEERIFVDVDGTTISGQMDVQEHPGNEVEIIDWKVTSVFRVINDSARKKWEEQLNLYRVIRHMDGRNGAVTKLTIVAFLRDWSKTKARQDPEYPQQPVVPIDIPLWPIGDALEYLRERVRLHVTADMRNDIGMDIDPCTDEERWKRGGVYEVIQEKKDGGEWMRKAMSDREEAERLAAEFRKTIKDSRRVWVREREAKPIRCLDGWCPVSEWCPQFQKERAAA